MGPAARRAFWKAPAAPGAEFCFQLLQAWLLDVTAHTTAAPWDAEHRWASGVKSVSVFFIPKTRRIRGQRRRKQGFPCSWTAIIPARESSFLYYICFPGKASVQCEKNKMSSELYKAAMKPPACASASSALPSLPQSSTPGLSCLLLSSEGCWVLPPVSLLASLRPCSHCGEFQRARGKYRMAKGRSVTETRLLWSKGI